MNKIKCNNVKYRQGYLEITPNIHDGLINIESWDIDPKVDITPLDISSEDFPCEAICGNTELELSLDDARELVRALEAAIKTLA